MKTIVEVTAGDSLADVSLSPSPGESRARWVRAVAIPRDS